MIASNETLLSLAYRIGAIGFSFISVSLLVKTLGPDQYGVWATLVSALVWIQMSDFGIGYVLKNRVAAREDELALCEQIAATVYLSTLIGLGMLAIYAVAGTHISIVRDYPVEAGFLYVVAFLALPAMVGVNILQGMGLASVSYRAAMVQALIWLVMILLMGDTASIRPLAVSFAALWILNGTYTFWRSYRALDLGRLGFTHRLLTIQPATRLWPILQVGGGFFLLQITSLVLFNLGTYLVYNYFSAAAAARYDILNKVFQIPMTLFNVVIAVVWATIARHLAQRDHKTVGRIQRQLLIASVGGGVLLMLVTYWIVPSFVRLYTHGRIEVSYVEVGAFAAQIAMQMVAYVGAVFMNAAERLRIQIAFAVAGTLVFLPLFHLLQGRGYGIEAVPLATLLVLLPSALYFNYYVRHHIIAPLATA